MSEMWQGILAAVISGVALSLIGWAAKAAWDRNSEKLQELSNENETLKAHKMAEEQKRMENLLKEMADTRHAVTKLEIRIEDLVKLIPVVDKLSKDLHALWQSHRANSSNGTTS